MNPAPGTFTERDAAGRDRWEDYTPTDSGFTHVGTTAFAGKFNKRGAVCLFDIDITPETSTATTAGTSYVNLPIAGRGKAGMATMVNRTTNVAVGVCVVSAANSRVYPPTQAASGNNFGISGWYEV